MKCSDCGREVCFTATGLCPRCTPREPGPIFYVVERDACSVQLLRLNEATKIMETTSERRYATTWDTEAAAVRAAEFYAPIWHDTNRGRLRVLRID